jgi:ABC-type glycerol-3-phosphate transport system substrate-binding protein
MKHGLLKRAIACAVAVVGLTAAACSIKQAPYDPETLYIGIINKGYGTEWLYKLVDAYKTDNADKKVEVVTPTSDVAWTSSVLLGGYKANKVDLLYAISGQSIVNDYIAPYPEMYLADLSSVYDIVPDGYAGNTKTVREMMNEYAMRSVTFEGKQYGVSYALGMEGMVYNPVLFSKNHLSIPRTTEEMFEVMDTIKDLDLKAPGGQKVYPFIYSGASTYTQYLTFPWWAQYEGQDSFQRYLEGKNEDGQYDVGATAQQGKLESLRVLEKLIAYNGGYVDKNDVTYNFTAVQNYFLNGLAFMIPNGDWLEREMSSNTDAAYHEFAFMRVPLISAITDNLPQHSIAKGDEATLRAAVDYADGVSATKPAGVHDDDLAFIAAARRTFAAESGHSAIVPIESPKKAEAKDFLKYMLSAKGQNIMMQYSLGNRVPLDDIDVTGFAAYNGLSTFAKSKLTFATDGVFVGHNYSTLMSYRGGIRLFITKGRVEENLGVTGGAYKSALTFFNEECNYFTLNWNRMLRDAGVK